MSSNNLYSSFYPLKNRLTTREVMVGCLGIGKNNPIRVQTMTNTDTLDISATVRQIVRCVEAGAELVRVTTQEPKHAQALARIKEKLLKKGIKIPIIADVHFLLTTAFEALKYADKVRINPGNLFDRKAFRKIIFTDKSYSSALNRLEDKLFPFISAAKKVKIPLRIGVNHGSLSDSILCRFGDTSLGMAESAMEYLRIFNKHGFNEIVVSVKASNPLVMIEANRLLVSLMRKEKMDYPLHLGVTEAGNGDEGRAKTMLGIGTLLLYGIGDTIRVSLTEAPEKEIPYSYAILQATHRRITKTEFISCPSCGRTRFDIEKITNAVKNRFGHLKGVRIAIMGCIVNGLGEMADADFGYVGGKAGKINLFYGKTLVKHDVPENQALDELEKLIKGKGIWREP